MTSKFANVVYAYSPKIDDELELTVGDKIEVIGFEEEGKFFFFALNTFIYFVRTLMFARILV